MTTPPQPIRVLVAKPGLDGHEMGAKLVARILRDAGMEVVYSGPRQTPEMVVAAALQEDVDVIGLSFLSGSHQGHCRRILGLLREEGLGDINVIVGGIIPRQDIPALKAMGVTAVFGPGTDHRDIIQTVQDLAKGRDG
ncbi:MAG: cobalamin B12-binding domain-containing protein [Dehalococcoidia bacterium]|jgi:methylmalonyl-CoA mutase C-terminal domain/subunit|nr:cobalamin B12-binding domain-containing protein [Dehalococcoidia bacterium]|tara:strand:- start:63 stop:476 length:414 start_codon:yes stop_codon:yes gene_type:complete